jgi:EAL domain-containing protein (putative c-di-GMP-specific phosphodiesterase class I)
MNTDKDSLSIVETIVTLAKKLGKTIVAEGVETDAHKTTLSALACDYGQGYLFSKPLNLLDAEEFLKNNTVFQDDNYQPLKLTTPNNIETTNQYAM